MVCIYSTAQYVSLLQVKLHSWGQQRCFAEAAVAPKFDWESLESSIASEDGKRDLASLRSTWIDVQQKFDSMAQVSRTESDQLHLKMLAGVRFLHGNAVEWRN